MFNKDLERKCYLLALENEVDLSYGRISLCNLKHFEKYARRDRYQVHDDTDPNAIYSEIFLNPKDAVDKFIEIKANSSDKARDKVLKLGPTIYHSLE